ncbi:MAG TPA: sulfur carrier protein ThiS [Dehalococcoidia bacterium]|nr:sulfur carrier protein ThiS [Dehalococcoidia bacterium]
MNVVVNGADSELSDGATVRDVLSLLALRDARGVAVARNGEVVVRGEWDATRLRDGDHLEVLHAVQGG